MWGLLEFLLPDSSIRARKSTTYLSIPNCFSLHDEREREIGMIKDGSWIEGNIITISQKIRKIKKIEQLGEYGMGNLQITKTLTLNKMCAMRIGGGNEHTCWR